MRRRCQPFTAEMKDTSKMARNTETAIGAKMAAKGIFAHNIRFQLAIAEFQNSGGEYGVALAMVNAAYGRGSEGRSSSAEGYSGSADASLGEKGRPTSADKAKGTVPSSPSTQRSAGLSSIADKARGVVPAAAPRNKPGHAKRGAAAIAGVQHVMATSLFDTLKLPDGRRLREVRWSECPGLATRYRRMSRILMALHGHGIPANPDSTVDNLINEDGLKQIVEAVERFNDIH